MDIWSLYACLYKLSIRYSEESIASCRFDSIWILDIVYPSQDIVYPD